MTAFWNITMSRKMKKRFETYLAKYQKEIGENVTRAAFGRLIFEFWERTIMNHDEKIIIFEKLIEEKQKEIRSIRQLTKKGAIEKRKQQIEKAKKEIEHHEESKKIVKKLSLVG